MMMMPFKHRPQGVLENRVLNTNISSDVHSCRLPFIYFYPTCSYDIAYEILLHCKCIR